MKLVMRKWRWLACLLAAGMVCAVYLLGQTPTAPTGTGSPATLTAAANVVAPDATETADSARLIGAVNTGDAQTALGILHTYGVAEDTLLAMATHLGAPSTRVELKEPFLKASVGELAMSDAVNKANARACSPAAATLGYGQAVCVARLLDTNPVTGYDAALTQGPVAPIAVLNIKLNDPCFIRFFRWYDRYAEYLHSVALNGENLNNAKLDPANYSQANRTLNALFQLIKARKPDAFVWLGVVKEDNRSDEPWLKAMTFQPDGLQISNLRQFHSPFVETRQRYAAIVGADTPMMVAGFYGYAAPLLQKGAMLSSAFTNADPQARQVATARAAAQLGSVGAIARHDLAQVETNLQSLGYRGLSAHWLLLTALANSTNAAPVDPSEIIDPRAGLLDIYYAQTNYARVLSLAANMVSNSSPGDMNWTVGKLYQGIALLSQSPPDTNGAIAALDGILAVDFTNRPGCDHYILGAVRWRINAAFISGDMEKPRQLVQWVQGQPLRADLKSAFLKQFGVFLTLPMTTSK